MARAWIELDGEQAGWGPTRVVVAKLSRDGYIVQVLTGSGPKVFIITAASCLTRKAAMRSANVLSTYRR
jgi:hypothetical protein